MKTINHTENTTFSETAAGNFQVTTGTVTYCFGDCFEWAERFFYSLIMKETTIRENDFAKIVFSEAWGYSVVSKVSTYKSGIPFRYTVSGLENCQRWFDELTKNCERSREIDNRLPDSWNVLINA